jgi:hypothetical protein
VNDRLANIVLAMGLWLAVVLTLILAQKRRKSADGDGGDSSGDVAGESSSAHQGGWFGHSGDSYHGGDSGGHGGDSGGDGGGDGGGGD